MNLFCLYQAAFLLQLAALCLFSAYWLKPRRALAFLGLLALSLGVLAHATFFFQRWNLQGELPLASNFDSLSFMALAGSLVFLAVEWRYRLGILGSFLLPIVLLFMFMGFRFVHLNESAHLSLQSGFLAAHVAFSMLAYSFFTTASGVGLAYLVQDKQLKSKHLGRVAYELPPLQALEHLAALCVAIGLGLFSLGLLSGSLWSKQSLGSYWVAGDPKTLFSLAIWLLYVFYLCLRLSGRFRGKKSTLLLLAGFLALFFGYYLINVYAGGHRFL